MARASECTGCLNPGLASEACLGRVLSFRLQYFHTCYLPCWKVLRLQKPKFHRHRLRHQPCCGAKASALSRTCKLVTHNQPAARSPCVFFGLSRFLLGFTNEEFQHGLQVEKHSMQQTHANATETKGDCTGCCRDISPPLAGFQVSDFDPAILWTSHDSRHNTQWSHGLKLWRFEQTQSLSFSEKMSLNRQRCHLAWVPIIRKMCTWTCKIENVCHVLGPPADWQPKTCEEEPAHRTHVYFCMSSVGVPIWCKEQVIKNKNKFHETPTSACGMVGINSALCRASKSTCERG